MIDEAEELDGGDEDDFVKTEEDVDDLGRIRRKVQMNRSMEDLQDMPLDTVGGKLQP